MKRSIHFIIQFIRQGGDDAARVYISDNMDFKEAELLHSMFLGKTAFTEHSEVLNWVYTIRKQELIRHLQKMASSNEREYMRGEWLSEALVFWDKNHDEQIGRSLLVYYLQKMRNGDRESRVKARDIYEELRVMPRTERKTDDLLKVVQRLLSNC